MATRLIDVTVSLSGQLATFPGDPRFRMEPTHRIAEGKPYNVAQLSLGTHAGTHVDAPYHFIEGGARVDELPLDALVGRARVVEVAGAPSVGPAELGRLDLSGAERLLVKTRNSGQLRGREFREDFVYLTPEGARSLAGSGIRLLGWDYLSIEKFGSQDFAAHHALLGKGVVVVEGLDLTEVEPGEYELACLPLRIAGADGSPARVVLRTLA